MKSIMNSEEQHEHGLCIHTQLYNDMNMIWCAVGHLYFSILSRRKGWKALTYAVEKMLEKSFLRNFTEYFEVKS
jgi:hypothetical protein